MRKLIFPLMILITSNIFSQHTPKYKDLIEDLIPIDSTVILKKNKQEILKVEGKQITYECNGNYFSFLKGKYSEYYDNGKLHQMADYDEIGTLTYAQKYNRNGRLLSEIIATQISSKTDDLCELLSEYDNLTIYLTVNYFKYSKSSDSIYKSKTVFLIDGKSIETQKFEEPKI